MSALVDPGLQPERTLLAWRRTCLALAIGVALTTRYLLELEAAFALLAGAIGLAGVVSAYLASAGRYRRVRRGFDGATGKLHSGGRSIAALAGIATAVSVAAVAFVLGPVG